mgnify:CR=1 FL=1
MENISVKITSVFETGVVKAKANAVLGRFGVRGIKVCEGKSGLFVAMPSYKSAKGKYIDIFFPMDKEAKEELAGSGPMRKNRRKTLRPRFWPGRNRGESVFLRKDKP